MTDPRYRIVDAIRQRVLRGVQAGTLRPHDRLPSARALADEFRVDYRSVIAAYKELAGEGLVELRPRGGVYVAASFAVERGGPPLPEPWIADLLSQSLARGIRAPQLYEWLRRCTETLRLRAVVIATAEDDADGLSRELSEDFGLESTGFTADEARAASPPPIEIRRADVVVSTSEHRVWVRSLADDLRKPHVIVEPRPDPTIGEWTLLLRRPVYAVVATAEFGQLLRRTFAGVPSADANLHVLVLGRDDLSAIPAEATMYVTRRARRQLGNATLPGRLMPTARTISPESAREIFGFIVRSNAQAMSRAGRSTSD